MLEEFLNPNLTLSVSIKPFAAADVFRPRPFRPCHFTTPPLNSAAKTQFAREEASFAHLCPFALRSPFHLELLPLLPLYYPSLPQLKNNSSSPRGLSSL